ncbi:DNA-binding transcriptional LysR family regulator [Sphingobium xenophagum]|uniref:DNA-binding transcriptional LysR family regulator n=1 Tax=Sphingobium xenophagum TaxID=121428 RepID=A0ABU1X860_SPHXE|nr:LysR family transcriptional regulator [Sphingobium xenophagum]MDR7157232.1 DNA-binding transcriptional LysR family regulator [Sphingobium xenophagum]
MNYKGLDLNLLVALDALLTERNVTRAASKLYISQPAMSIALQRLRTHFDDELLKRVGRKLELTPKGITFESEVKDVLSRISALLQNEPTFEPAINSRSFRIAMTDFCARVFGVPFVGELRQQAPLSTCQIDEFSADALDRLNEGTIDFCIAAAGSALTDGRRGSQASDDTQSFRRVSLFQDEFVLVADAGNNAIRAGIDFDDFRRMPYVEVRFNSEVPSLVDQALRLQEERPTSVLVVPSFATAIEIIIGTDLVCLVPSLMAGRLANTHRIKTVQPPLSLPVLNETLIWHSRNEIDPAHRWLRECLLTVAQRYFAITADHGAVTI